MPEIPEVLNELGYEAIRAVYELLGPVDEEAFFREFDKDPFGSVTWLYARGGEIREADLKAARREDERVYRILKDRAALPTTATGEVPNKVPGCPEKETKPKRARKKGAHREHGL